jgi:hypothetical protein
MRNFTHLHTNASLAASNQSKLISHPKDQWIGFSKSPGLVIPPKKGYEAARATQTENNTKIGGP